MPHRRAEFVRVYVICRGQESTLCRRCTLLCAIRTCAGGWTRMGREAAKECQRAAKKDGRGMSRIVRNPGAAVNTWGIALTVIEAVAISP